MAAKPGRVGKIRTKSAAKKRIRRTGGGNLAIKKVGHKHLLLQKSKRQKAKASKPLMLAKGDSSRMEKLISF
ncbi:50S ribosomal protein L35 [Candidatus Peregrinibacteria bacterium]|nr:MAG: 50S ribosomal protein L35 [Candidatus Peregrinibacteria bacterium]